MRVERANLQLEKERVKRHLAKVREWKKQKVWKNRIAEESPQNLEDQEISSQQEFLMSPKSPKKLKNKLSIDNRDGLDSHLIRDSYVMHMLRKDPSKISVHLPLQNEDKRQYWKSLLNKKWDSLKCQELPLSKSVSVQAIRLSKNTGINGERKSSQLTVFPEVEKLRNRFQRSHNTSKLLKSLDTPQNGNLSKKGYSVAVNPLAKRILIDAGKNYLKQNEYYKFSY